MLPCHKLQENFDMMSTILSYGIENTIQIQILQWNCNFIFFLLYLLIICIIIPKFNLLRKWEYIFPLSSAYCETDCRGNQKCKCVSGLSAAEHEQLVSLSYSTHPLTQTCSVRSSLAVSLSPPTAVSLTLPPPGRSTISEIWSPGSLTRRKRKHRFYSVTRWVVWSPGRRNRRLIFLSIVDRWVPVVLVVLLVLLVLLGPSMGQGRALNMTPLAATQLGALNLGPIGVSERAQKSGSAKSIQRAAVRMKFTFVFYVEIDSRLCSTTRRTDSASERNVSESALRSYLQMYLYLPCTVDAINEKTFALDEIVL